MNINSKPLGFSHDGYEKQLPETSIQDNSDLICAYLNQIGVEYVFGIPGGSLEPFYNGLARASRSSNLKSIIARHESGAAFMADGYARETGKLGVCCATTGPGATNMLTGIACAYQDNIPLLAITAQTALENFGRGAVQDSSCTGVNTLAIYETCTRYNSFVSHKEQLERKLVSAILAAFQEPKGPVHLSIPLDILRQSPNNSSPSFDLAELLRQHNVIDIEKTDELFKRLSNANKLCFLIGDKVSNCIGLVLELALLFDADVITTPQGRGFVSSCYPNFKGVFGLAGHSTASEVLSDPDLDLVVAIGTSLEEQATNGWDKASLLNSRLVHVDENPQHFSRSLEAQLHLQGNLSCIFKHLSEKFYASNKLQIHKPNGFNDGEHSYSGIIKDKLKAVPFSNPARETSINDRVASLPFKLTKEYKLFTEEAPIKPQRLMMELPELFPSGTRYLADIGNSFLWAIHYLQPKDRRLLGNRKWTGGALRTGMGFASMGWSIGAAIGTAIANRNNPVVCICGDGSTLMSGQEITTAVAEQLTVIYVILNDSAFGTVKHGQRLAGAESIAHTLPRVSFAKVAHAVGAHGHEIRSVDDLRLLNIDEICKHKGPTVLDVYIDPEETPPFATRLKVLNATNSTFLTGHLSINPAETF